MLRPFLGSTLTARRLGSGLWSGQQGCSPNSPTHLGGPRPCARRLCGCGTLARGLLIPRFEPLISFRNAEFLSTQAASRTLNGEG